MIKLKFIFCLVVMLAINFGYSQSNIKIIVQDKLDKKIIENCLIIVTSKDGQISTNRTNADGFAIIDNFDGKISFSAYGFKELEMQTIQNNDIIYLEKKEENLIILQEIEVKNTQNYLHRTKDTIIFAGDKLRNSQTATIEDLIANIPGVSVDILTGKINYNNVEISTILVDGENIVNNNYQIISKNLTDKLVKSIQVINGYHNSKLLKNLSKSNKIALNIEVENLYKNIIKGNIDAGYGPDRWRDFSTNIFLINNSLKTINTVGSNNTGNLSLGKILDDEVTESFLVNTNALDLVNSRFRNFNVNRAINLLNQNNISINDDFLANTTNKITIDKTAKVLIKAMYWSDAPIVFKDINFINENLNQNIRTFIENQEQITKYNLNFEISKTLDLNQELKINTSFNNNTNTFFQKNFNSVNNIRSKTDHQNFNFTTQYINRFNNNQALILSNTISLFKTDEEINRSLQFFTQQFNISNICNNYNVNFIQKINSKKFFTFGIEQNNVAYTATVFTPNVDNRNQYISNDFSIFSQFSYFNKKNKFVSSLKYNNINFINFDNNLLSRKYFLPQISYIFNNVKNNIEVNFGTNLQTENFVYRNSIFLQNDLNSFIQSNSDNLPFYKNNTLDITLRRKLEDIYYENYLILNHSFGEKNYISNNSFTDNFFFITSENYANKYSSSSIKVGFEKFFPRINIYLTYVPKFSTVRWNNFNNDELFSNYVSRLEHKLLLKSKFNFLLNFSSGLILNNVDFEATSTTNTVNNSFKQITFYNSLFIELFAKKLNLKVNNEYVRYTNLNPFNFTSLVMNYKLKNPKLSLEFEARNLLNYSNFSERFVSQNIIIESSTIILPRTVIFKIKYVL